MTIGCPTPRIPASLTRLAAAALFAAAAPAAALAQDYPTQPVTIVVAYPPGGATDTAVRATAEPLSKILGQPVLVQNVGGAGGGVAAVRVAAAKPDGYTLLATTSSTFSLEPLVQKTAYSSDDFVHVGIIGENQGAMFANAKKPFGTLAEMIAVAKRENRPIKFANFFMLDRLVMQYIGIKEGVEMIPVPVKGGSGAAQAVLAGDVDAAYSGGSWAPLVQAGDAKALFATSHERLKMAPDLVSMKDLGYEFGTTSYMVLSAPKGTPDAIVQKLSAALVKAVADPMPQDLGKKRFIDMTAQDAAGAAKVLESEIHSFQQIMKTIDAAKK